MFNIQTKRLIGLGELVVALLILAIPQIANAQCTNYQRVYVTTKESNSNVNGGGGNTDVSNESGSLGPDLNDYSSITIPPSHLARFSRLGFPKTFTGGEPIHIKLSSSIDFSSTAITGEIQAYYNGTPVGTKVVISSAPYLDVLAGENISDIVIPNPGPMYDEVQVTITGGFPPSGDIHELRIYAAYVNEYTSSPIDCNTAVDVLYGVTGGVLSTSNAVNNPTNATDASLTTYAEIKQNVGAAGYVHLTTLLPTPTISGDLMSFTIQIPGVTTLDASIFNKLSVIAYLGNTQVGTVTANDPNIVVSLVDAVNHIYKFTYPVNASFDRISVRAGGSNTAYNTVYLYDMRSAVASPVVKVDGVTTNSATFCYSANAQLTIDPVQSCTIYKTYDAAVGGNLLYTGTSYSLSGLPAGTYNYYVEATRSNCTATTSARTKVTLIVNPAPTITLGSILPVCVGSTTTALPYTATTGSPTTYSIVWDAAAIAAGFVDVVDAVLPASPITVAIANGTPVGVYHGTLAVKNGNSCAGNVSFSVEVKAISPHPLLSIISN